MPKRKKGSVKSLYDLDFKNYSLQKDGITQSMITAFLNCRMKFLLVANRWTSDSKQKTTSFGSMFHDMLDKTYTLWIEDNRIVSSEELSLWLDEYIEEAAVKSYDKVSRADLETQATLCQVIIEEYLIFYEEDFEEKRFAWAERTFDFVDEYGIRRRGKIDGKYYSNKNGKPWLMEHKTKSRITEDTLMLKLSFDFQNLFYIEAEEHDTGEKIQGMLYNVIRNPGHKRKGGESLYQYGERIREDIKKRPEHFFKRYEVPYTNKDKLRFKIELGHLLKEIKNLVSGKSFPYKNQSSCITSWSCSFLQACSSGTLNSYKQKETLFTELQES